MKDVIHSIKSTIIGSIYRGILKPIFFIHDPEDVHDRMTAMGMFLGRHAITRHITRWTIYYEDPMLYQTLSDIVFKNPIGLSAGFDKDANLTDILPEVGFGFEEIGSVTGEPCEGNPKPRLWRLKNSKSLLVYYGLKNEGCEKISAKLRGKKFVFPLGVSVAKTNSPDVVDEQAGIADYVKAYRTFVECGIGDYYTINISCPNTFGGEPFTSPERLEHLLEEITKIKTDKPIFIKMPAELPTDTIDRIIAIARKYKITGFICTNLAKNRINKNIKDTGVPDKGGMSGKVVEDLSNTLIRHIYQTTKKEFIIIGCGGVFNAQDAYKKIKLGASLIQIITGMIFEGPQVIGEINRGLVSLLKADGYKNISDAIGTDINPVVRERRG